MSDQAGPLSCLLEQLDPGQASVQRKIEKGLVPFRLNNCWIQHKGFAFLVSKAWNEVVVSGRKAYTVKEKLKYLKEALKVWNKVTFGFLDTNLAKLSMDIQELGILGESLVLDSDQLSLCKKLLIEWWKITNLRDNLLRQKSRSKWLKEGDANTSYFHACINNRRQRNQIMGVWINEVWLGEDSILTNGINNYFKNLFSMGPMIKLTLDGVKFSKLSANQLHDLDAVFLEGGIKRAVWSCVGDKSPGLDGFNFRFF
ncbi:PREDICTED: uncharacterized protein LOC109330899 [Lupinus angustifolius]|uniref:uncharacterized protein LOC109330899 n=1 Tax=Lupinus angustifolius TaxID=3871 RepID=UPI00092F344C|nr:PREDICTED: uncharacterized protein LOC109330899 [Lupinus angustifolius]